MALLLYCGICTEASGPCVDSGNSDATAQLGPLMARPRILSRSFGFGSWAELIVYG